MSTNMVDVVQPVQLGFVIHGVPFETRNALLDCLPEPRADLEILLGGALSGHREHLGEGKI